MDKIKDSYIKYKRDEGTIFSNKDIWLVTLFDLWLHNKNYRKN